LDQFVAVAKSSNACLLHDGQRRQVNGIYYTTESIHLYHVRLSDVIKGFTYLLVNTGLHSLEDKQIIYKMLKTTHKHVLYCGWFNLNVDKLIQKLVTAAA